MKKLYLTIAVAAVALFGAPRAASADGFNFLLKLDPVGLESGRRIEGLELRNVETDFFHREQGGLVGFRTGLELMFVSLYFDYKRFYNTDGWKGTWMAAMADVHHEFQLGPGSPVFGLIALEAGYGWGLSSGGVFDQPDIGDIGDQDGIIAQLRLGPEFYMSRYFAVGLEFLVGYHYLWLDNDVLDLANVAVEDNVQGIHYSGMLTFTFKLGTGNLAMVPSRYQPQPVVTQPIYQGPVYQTPPPVYQTPPPAYQHPAPPPAPVQPSPPEEVPGY